MKYSFLYICLCCSFVAFCCAKEIEIGAVLQLDKDAIQKIAAVLQKTENKTNPEKQYVDHLKEVIMIMKSYDADKLGEVFHAITENVKKMLEKENVTNTNLFKDLSKVKYEIRDKMRRKLLDETLKALEDTSDAGKRRQKLIQEASKDFKKEDITSFINYLKMFKHDTKRANTRTHGFKKSMNRIIKATMIILKCLKEDMVKNKHQKITTTTTRKPHHFPEPVFDDKFEYDNQDEGLKMKLDHDYFVMDRLWEELAQTTKKSPLRTRPAPTTISEADKTDTVIPFQNEEIFVNEFDTTTTPLWQHKHLEKHVLADFDIEVKKTTNREPVEKSDVFNTERDVNNKEKPSELLRQLYPSKKKSKNVKILRLDSEKAETERNPVKEKLLELIKANSQIQTTLDDNKGSEMLRQRLPHHVKVSKKHKKKKKSNDESSELIRGQIRQKKSDDDKLLENNKFGRFKKQKTIQIRDSLELIRDAIKKQKDKTEVSSELPGLKHRGEAKKPSDAEDEKVSAELIRQLFPPEMKIMNVKILKQENGIPQEIHLEHDALIDVRNFGQRSQNNDPN